MLQRNGYVPARLLIWRMPNGQLQLESIRPHSQSKVETTGSRTIITMSAAFCILSGKKKLSVILEPENTRKHILAPNDIPYSAVVHVAIAFRILDGKEQCKGETYRADAVNYSETGEISISFAGAYEKEAGKKLIRTADFFAGKPVNFRSKIA